MNVPALIVLLVWSFLENGNKCESVKHFVDIIETTEQRQADASANAKTIEYVSIEQEISVEETLEVEISEVEILDYQTLDDETFNNKSLDNGMVDIETPNNNQLDNETQKIEKIMEKTKLIKETAATQSKLAKTTKSKSTVEVHS